MLSREIFQIATERVSRNLVSNVLHVFFRMIQRIFNNEISAECGEGSKRQEWHHRGGTVFPKPAKRLKMLPAPAFFTFRPQKTGKNRCRSVAEKAPQCRSILKYAENEVKSVSPDFDDGRLPTHPGESPHDARWIRREAASIRSPLPCLSYIFISLFFIRCSIRAPDCRFFPSFSTSPWKLPVSLVSTYGGYWPLSNANIVSRKRNAFLISSLC